MSKRQWNRACKIPKTVPVAQLARSTGTRNPEYHIVVDVRVGMGTFKISVPGKSRSGSGCFECFEDLPPGVLLYSGRLA